MADLKVTVDHLRRDAYLYVRQSTLRQVAENIESTNVNMLCVTGPWQLAGRLSGSM